MSKNNFLAAVLMGGKSSRMGRDKSRLKTNDGEPITFLENALSQLRSALPQETEILISGYGKNHPDIDPELFVQDLVSDLGPLGGIYTLLETRVSDQGLLLVIPVDVPELNSELIHRFYSLFSSLKVKTDITRISGENFPLIIKKSESIMADLKSILFDSNSDIDLSLKGFINSHFFCEIEALQFQGKMPDNLNNQDQYNEYILRGQL